MGTQTRNFMNSQFNLDVKLIPLLIANKNMKIILSASFYLWHKAFLHFLIVIKNSYAVFLYMHLK
jgi:hypothetical protein